MERPLRREAVTKMRSQFILSIFAGLTALSIAACGGTSGTASPVNGATALPTLNLYPNQSSNSAPTYSP